jgi:hemoglobin/transferrin/lactoferrin receptor protein
MMKSKKSIRFFWGLCCFLFCLKNDSIAQENTDSIRKELETIVISGSKFAEKKKNIIQKIDIISSKDIKKANAQNMGDLLMSTGNVFVQKSQQGGSSPVIRGFEASRVLLVVDGVRMNNAIYRSGHLQNIITVDQNILERVEVLQGPSSTLYGSDALGGAVHMMTRDPKLSVDGKKINLASNVLTRYSSVNNEKTIHADFNVGGKKWGSLTSFSFSDFGDMRMGKKDRKGFEGFGTRPYYIQPFDGINGDTILKNNNDRLQRFSGYSQTDFLQKILFKQNENTSHVLNFQLSTSSDVPRYDRLQDVRNGSLRFASWYYGPQERRMLSYHFNHHAISGFFQEYNAVASFQDIEESRITREFKRYDRLDKRLENIKVGGLTLDARRKTKKDEIVTGIDIQMNDLHSIGIRTNLLTNQVSALDSRYPNGKNNMNLAALYVQHLRKIKEGKWVLNEGLRFQYSSLYSNITDNSFFQLPVTEVRQKNSAFTGNIGLIYNTSKDSRIRMGYASGFRSPNIDDLSKIFESSTAAKQVVVPNPDLKPEYTHNLDFGWNQSLGSYLSMELSFYHTRFSNAIVKAPFQLNGQDSIVYYNVKSQVLASQNVNKANVLGGSIEMNGRWGKYWKASGSYSIVKGNFEVDKNTTTTLYQRQLNGSYALVKTNTGRKPLDHIPPSFGKISIGYDNQKWYAELFFMYNGWKRLDAYNPDGEDNAQYATSQGTSAWQTWNMRAGYSVGKSLQLQVACENMLDLNYRYFASGFSAGGRNLMLSLRGSF